MKIHATKYDFELVENWWGVNMLHLWSAIDKIDMVSIYVFKLLMYMLFSNFQYFRVY